MFQVYDMSLNKVSEFGIHGRGPSEFIRTPVIEDIYQDSISTKILVLDEFRKEIISIDLKSSIQKGELITSKKYTIPEQLYGLMDLFYTEDETFVGIYDDRFDKQLDHQGGWFEYVPSSGNFSTYPLRNLTLQPNNDLAETNLNARNPVISKQRDSLAAILIHEPILELIDLNNNHRNVIQTMEFEVPEFYNLDSFNQGELTEYYRSATATDSHIYLLKSEVAMTAMQVPTTLQKLDWQGNLLVEYRIPAEYDLSMVQVDDASHTLYGLSYSNDAVYKFQLN